MAPDSRPPFATYLLPSFSLPFRRRQSSTATACSYNSDTPPSLSFSARSSISTSPGTSPPNFTTIQSHPTTQRGLIHEALQSTSKATPPADLGNRLYRAQPNTLKCLTCATDIAFADQIVSKGFTGRHGRAYLVAPPPSPPQTPGSQMSNQYRDLKAGDLINTKVGRNVNRELLTGAHVVAEVSCVICSTVLGWKYVDARELAQKYKIGKFILEMKRVVQVLGWEDGVGAQGEDAEQDNELGKRDDRADNVVMFDEDDEDECEDLFSGVWDPDIVAKRRARRVTRR